MWDRVDRGGKSVCQYASDSSLQKEKYFRKPHTHFLSASCSRILGVQALASPSGFQASDSLTLQARRCADGLRRPSVQAVIQTVSTVFRRHSGWHAYLPMLGRPKQPRMREISDADLESLPSLSMASMDRRLEQGSPRLGHQRSRRS